MAKELPYFKFFVSEWSDGDITLEDMDVQGLFINICAYYWSNNCEVTLEKAKKKFRGFDDQFNTLIDSEIISVIHDGFLSINFLNEQKDERSAISSKNSEAGKASALARKEEKQRKLNEKVTPVEITFNGNPTIKRREEKKREEKKREEKKKRFSPPTILEVKDYFKEKGYTDSSAVKAFEYYDVAGWKDSKGNQVKNWKQKMLSVWFKPENKFIERSKKRVIDL